MLIKKKQQSNVISPSQEDDLSAWPLPTITTIKNNDDTTNVLGLKKTWSYEPPDADKITEPQPLTAEELELIRQAAHNEGFSEGKEQGFAQGYDEGKTSGFEAGKEQGNVEGIAEGLADGQEQIAVLTQQWQSLVNKLHEPMTKVDKNVEQQLFQLVVQLTETVVKKEVQTNADILMAAIGEAIKALPAQETQTQIYLHPSDIIRVQAAFGDDHIKDSGWRLLSAPEFEIGSCQVENSTSNIDMRIKSRIDDVLEPFLQNALHQ